MEGLDAPTKMALLRVGQEVRCKSPFYSIAMPIYTPADNTLIDLPMFFSFTLPAGASGRRQSAPRAHLPGRDDGMGDPLFSHTAPDFGNIVGQLRCETVHAGRHRVRINAQLGC